MSCPASPRTRMRPIGPASPIVTAPRPRIFLAGGRSARSGRWPSRVCITGKPAARQARSSRRFGSIVERSSETSLPSISPKPPGSRKSRCMSMMSSAHREGSNTKSYGSAVDRQAARVRSPLRRGVSRGHGLTLSWPCCGSSGVLSVLRANRPRRRPHRAMQGDSRRSAVARGAQRGGARAGVARVARRAHRCCSCSPCNTGHTPPREHAAAATSGNRLRTRGNRAARPVGKRLANGAACPRRTLSRRRR